MTLFTRRCVTCDRPLPLFRFQHQCYSCEIIGVAKEAVEYHSTNRHDEAVQRFAHVFGARINLPDKWYYSMKYGISLYQCGRYRECIPFLDAALGFESKAEIGGERASILQTKAHSLLRLGAHSEAAACCWSLLRDEPHHAFAWFVRGEALRHSNQFVEAIDCYDTALAIAPLTAEFVAFAPTALHNKNFLLAKAHYDCWIIQLLSVDKLMQVDPNRDWLINKALILTILGRYGEARRLFGDGTNLDIFAQQQMRECVEKSSTARLVHIYGDAQCADALYARGHYSEALTSLDRDPPDVRKRDNYWHEKRGLCQVALGNLEEAVAEFEQANLRETWLAECLIELGRFVEAIGELDNLTSRLSDQSERERGRIKAIRDSCERRLEWRQRINNSPGLWSAQCSN